MKKLRFLQIILAIMSIAGWALAVYALTVFHDARPDRAVGYFFSHGVPVRLYWDLKETTLLEHIIWVCAGLSFTSMALNWYLASHYRMGYWFNIPLLLLSSVTAGLYLRFVIL
ncbi:hypothetical protein KDN34_08575 [Shewanella yunxiaonensis]|uniref:Uncharacterized protein n=1 Tax=Shewanella yunxiaonensis TaxID=2829809 RepID=A0ABX7YXN3_9GAMM|nr:MULTISPECIES: hypothetical protein [Shewanella]MDF0534373.1 hypothetical protein [Shewanella sp. A32]QUN07435.1 hypothetical protein KDN34_08575 [Shewanella yunxiaonensis]